MQPILSEGRMLVHTWACVLEYALQPTFTASTSQALLPVTVNPRKFLRKKNTFCFLNSMRGLPTPALAILQPFNGQSSH